MFSAEQISELKANKKYKKTRGVCYNWQFSRSVRSSRDFQIGIDISVDGVPWQYLFFLSKFVIWMFKGVIISHEIGKYRNDVVERIIDSSIPINFDIGVLITDNYKWVSESSHKLEQIRRFVKTFITDSEIQVLLYTTLELNRQDDRQKLLLNLFTRVDAMFNQKITDILKKRHISSERDYNDYLVDNCQSLVMLQQMNQASGNLFTVQENRAEVTSNG